MDNLTIYGHLDRELEKNENAKAKNKEICTTSKTNKGKENVAPEVAHIANGLMKAMVSQRLRRERESLGQCIQPKQSSFFPNLTPRRRPRACQEPGMIATDNIQSTSMSVVVDVDGVSCHHESQTHLPSMPPPCNFGNKLLGISSVTIGNLPSHYEPHVHLPSVLSPRNLAEEFLAMSSHPEPQLQLPSIPPPLNMNIGGECHATMPSTSLAPVNRFPKGVPWIRYHGIYKKSSI